MVVLVILLGAWLTGMVGLSYHILMDVAWSNNRDVTTTLLALLVVAMLTVWMFNSKIGHL